MAFFNADKLGFQNAAYQIRIRTIHNQKDSLLHKLVIQITCGLFQRKKSFLTGHIGKVNNLTDHGLHIVCRSLEHK